SVETNVREVVARALQSEDTLAIMLEWVDQTPNDSVVKVQDFSDMAALQFSLSDGQPFFCMGQEGGDVNIWAWKADWQSDLLAWQDLEDVYEGMYVEQYPFTQVEGDQQPGPGDYIETAYLPALEVGNLVAVPGRGTPVENLVAGGFGTLTALPVQQETIQGYGEWADGKWRVIFSRQLNVDTSKEVNFEPGRMYSLAIAVWDGEFGERNGQKSTSQWLSMQVTSELPARPPAAVEPAAMPWWRSAEIVGFILVGGVVLLLIIGAIIYLRLPE
ncbi:MAG: ethylbenzene dehydrogenase-related protein, partial [Anaerolineales bacterium]